MSLRLTQNTSLGITMTPQLQQSIQLLQLSSIELRTEILNALENNPLLELDDHVAEEEAEQISAQQYESKSISRGPADGAAYDFADNSGVSLHQDCLWQLSMMRCDETLAHIMKCLIDDLDDRGYLMSPPTELLETIAHQHIACDHELLDEAIATLQTFEPAGIGARNLKECLQLQCERFHQEHPLFSLASTLIQEYLSEIAKDEIKRVIKKTKHTEDDVKQAVELIQQLNPHPGYSMAPTHTDYIVPDVIIDKSSSGWQVKLNPALIPKVSVNPTYAQYIKRADDSDINMYLKDNLNEAKNLIAGIASRESTLLKVTRALVEAQEDFLSHGPIGLKPLTLEDIASEIDMHESTVSRVTTNKYMLTPLGTFELKYLFSSPVTLQNGEKSSATAIRTLIEQLIHTEPHDKPLSDNSIAQILADQGVCLARRTVTKYRENMGILSSAHRRL